MDLILCIGDENNASDVVMGPGRQYLFAVLKEFLVCDADERVNDEVRKLTHLVDILMRN